MKNTHTKSNHDPSDFNVSSQEVEQVIKLAKGKYDIDLPKNEGVRLAKLIKKLDWWQSAVSGKAATRAISNDMAEELMVLLDKETGKEYSLEEAKDSARALLTLVPFQEKRRIGDEIRGMLVEYRPIPNDPGITEKTRELLKNHYGADLTTEQLDQVIQLIYRTLWFEEGLDSSMDACLDDLLKYVDKRRGNKRTSGLNLHDAVRKAFDLSMGKLLKEKFEPLYQ